MLCPRCSRARIERNGIAVRCAVCGMSYDPHTETLAPPQKQSSSAPSTAYHT